MAGKYDNFTVDKDNPTKKVPIELIQMNIHVSSTTYQNMKDVIESGDTDFKYGFPPRKGNPLDFKDRKNCATFFGTCGLDLPYENGNVRKFVIPAMEANGAKTLDKRVIKKEKEVKKVMN